MVLVAIVAVVVVLLVVVIAFSRRRPSYLSDVDRFHHARSITTTWSEQGAPRPVGAAVSTTRSGDSKKDDGAQG
jgi:heme/copper-type cytochrome/quinol oxidase subunit 2